MISPRSLSPCRPEPPRSPGAATRVRGRDEVLDRITESCAGPGAVPLVLVTGPAGVGRSAVLAETRTRVAALGMCAVDMPVVYRGLDVPEVVSAIPGALGAGPEGGESPWAALQRELAGRKTRVVVFLDDVQRLDAHSARRMLAAIGELARFPITFVCAVRTPAAGRAPAELLGAGRVRTERLRPLPVSAVRRILVDRLGAKPAGGLETALRDECRGMPAVVHAAVDGYLRGGSLRVVDQHAHLVSGRSPEQSGGDSLPAVPGGLDADSLDLPVLKALAVLHPLREAAPTLISEAVGCGDHQVRRVLHDWCARGLLLPDRRGGMRFRIPMLASLLTGRLGLFERRRISQLAVAALTTGAATAPDEHYLADRLADAGNLVDRDRAITELCHRGNDIAAADGARAERWLRAAVKLCTDPEARAALLHRHAVVCVRHSRFHRATGIADAALRTDLRWLPAEAAQELRIIRVLGLAGARDLAALHDLADGVADGPGGDAAGIIVRGAALCLLDRWGEAHELLTGNASSWRDGDASTVLFGRLLRGVSGAVLGRTSETGEPPPPAGTAAEVAAMLLDALTLHTGTGLLPWLPPRMGAAERAIRAARAGDWDDALDRCRAVLAAGSVHGPAPGLTVLFREMATMLIARGRLSRAGAVLAEARARNLPKRHLLLLTEADLADLLDDRGRARALLEEALRGAAEAGVGAAEVWRRLACWEVRHGTVATASRCAARAGDADPMPDAARLEPLLARAVADSDPAAATAAIEASQDPFGYATTVLAVAERGLAEPGALRAAYRIFGELDALLPRARMRGLVPAGELGEGRAVTVEENERLLARLVVEGLSNQQLAAVLGSTEKSVEGRLSRCFKRTGYRSRAELATATVSDEFFGTYGI